MWDDDFERLLRQALPGLDVNQPLVPDVQLLPLGLDSLATISLIASLESHYDIMLPDETLTAATFDTPASLWAVVADTQATSIDPN
jgi:acyl carrier protein